MSRVEKFASFAMAIEGGRISKKDKDLIAESRAYKAAAQRKAQRSAHAQWRGDALQAVGLTEDGKMRRQVERRAAAQAKNRKARLKNARQRAEDRLFDLIAARKFSRSHTS